MAAVSLRHIALGFVVAIGVSSTTSARATTIASSTFDTNSDGWMVGNIVNTAQAMESPTYNATGGNPGGYISTTDDYDIVGFFAPGKYLGDQSSASGGTFSFSLSDSVTPDGVPYPTLFLYGAGMVISAQAPAPTPTSSPSSPQPFTDYSFTLSAGNFDIFTPSSGNETQGSTPPTAAQFSAILSNLTNVAIEADWHSGADLTNLDNVVLSSASPATNVPEPASLSLLGAAFVGFGAIRRQQRRR